MRLTTFSDYALRMLMLAASADPRLITIDETAHTFGVSRAHLMKVANVLTRAGFLTAVRGRSGGLALARRPEDVRLGDIVLATEPDFALVECFQTGNQCILSNCCRLPRILNEAVGNFIGTLDRYTLRDIMLRPTDFGLPAPAAA